MHLWTYIEVRTGVYRIEWNEDIGWNEFYQ